MGSSDMANVVPNFNENDCKAFDKLLVDLQNVDNDIRKKAEETYDEIPGDRKVLLLFNALGRRDGGDDAASFSAVLFRRLLYAEFAESFPKLPLDTQNHMRNQLLLIIQQDIPSGLRKKICDAVAELARNLIDDDGNNHWPEFLKFLFESASSPNLVLKESSLLMFAAVPGVFGNMQVRYLDVIRQMLFQCLGDQTSEAVRYAAVKALSAFIVAHEKEGTIYKHFSDCLPLLLQILSFSIEKQEEESTEMVLRNIVDMGEVCPAFFRGQLDLLLQLCSKVIANENSSQECRHMALEVVVTLSETAPAMVRKYGLKVIAHIVPIILNMMMALDDDENWDFIDEAIDNENDSDPVIGESSLDRLACALGGKIFLPFVMECVPQMLNNTNWKHRHAALFAISAIGEGCNKSMEALLPQIVDAVLQYLQDAHFRVRYAACNALGQMATDFAPLFEKKYHEKVIPGLLLLLSNPSSPRVQAHAGAALVNFFEECPKSILTTYLDSIIDKLEAVLNATLTDLVAKGKKLVLEQTVVTLASVADTVEEKFVIYYDRFMPCLKYIMENANTTELRLLRGKTIECVSLIGLAVGKEKFAPDAEGIMNLLLKSQTDEGAMTDDDPQLSYMISAWARICKILGKSFEPYLPYVMGPVMKTAGLKPEIAVLDSDDMKVVEEDDDWQFVSLGEHQNFGVRTAGLEDKATACQMLVCYAKELKEAFAPYVEEVVKLMVPLLKFYFHDGVRGAAAESLPSLLECAKTHGGTYLADMWNYILPDLLLAIDSEPEKDVVTTHMQSLAECITVLGGHCIPPEHLKKLMELMDAKLKIHFISAQERLEKRKDEDYDETLEESLLVEDEEDTYILSKIADIMHSLFAVYKTDFYPYFDMILQHFVNLLRPERPWPDRQWSICVFDDAIEHGGPACMQYQQYFLQPMLVSLNDVSPEVRQAAAYGFGILGEVGGPEFAKACAESIPLMIQMINAQDSRTPEHCNATENAIAAVTKIMAHNNTGISMDEMIPMWISWLPVWEDEDEAPHVYNFLCTLLEQNNPTLLGKDNCNLPRIVAIIAEVFLKEAVEIQSDVGKRLITLVNVIQNNGDIFNVCIAQLTPQQQEALHKALNQQC